MFSDQSRYDLCDHLNGLAIAAALPPRGAVEGRFLAGDSLGVITIPSGPIRWVNVRKEIGIDVDYYFTDYGVPDGRLHKQLSPFFDLSIECTANGGVWPFGRPKDILWRGNDRGLGLLGKLNSDGALKEPLLSRTFSRRPLSVRAHTGHGCWTITVPGGDTTVFLLGIFRPKIDFPSLEQWHCYQAIARHLLNPP
jgi:hypothetical protein